MARLLTIPVALAACLTFSAQAAPLPPDAVRAAYYYPAAVGAKAVYQGAGATWTQTVTAVEAAGGARLVTEEKVFPHEQADDGNPVKLVMVTKVSPTEVFEVRRGRAEYDAPLCLLKLPRAGRGEWTDPAVRKGRSALRGPGLKFVATGPEDVRVPAGEFKAIKVVMGSVFPGEGTGTSTRWYAPVVGLVKQVEVDAAGSRVAIVLKSFTPGNE